MLTGTTTLHVKNQTTVTTKAVSHTTPILKNVAAKEDNPTLHKTGNNVFLHLPLLSPYQQTIAINGIIINSRPASNAPPVLPTPPPTTEQTLGPNVLPNFHKQSTGVLLEQQIISADYVTPHTCLILILIHVS